MTLQASGAISLADVAGEFGGAAPHALGEYYGVASGVPASGAISLSHFYGTSASEIVQFVVGYSGSVSTADVGVQTAGGRIAFGSFPGTHTVNGNTLLGLYCGHIGYDWFVLSLYFSGNITVASQFNKLTMNGLEFLSSNLGASSYNSLNNWTSSSWHIGTGVFGVSGGDINTLGNWLQSQIGTTVDAVFLK